MRRALGPRADGRLAAEPDAEDGEHGRDPGHEIDPLAPHAAHVHLRQARPGALQCKLEHGTLNFPAMLATLAGHGYRGRLAIEYVHQGYMDTLHDDVLSETIKMRDLVRLQTASPAAR